MNIKTNRKRASSRNKTNKETTNDLSYALNAAKAASEKKAENILLLDTSKLTIIADYFLIVSANSTPQIEAIAKYIEESLSKEKLRLVSKEGISTSNGTVLDFGNLIVHIMNDKERQFYRLEKFWSNATIINNKLWEKAS